MKDQNKTKMELINEVMELRRRITELGALEKEHKRTEEALRESEEKFRKLFDDAPVGYHEFDIEGRITNVNRTELEMLGYTLEEVAGQFVWRFITEGEKSRQAVLGKLTGVILPAQSLERTYRRKDGTTFPVLIQDQLLQDEKGRITGIRSTIQDFTERKHAEEAFQRSEEEAKKLARENATMAEIGKIISSTLDIEDVYERFADEVHKIISFDRIVINVINLEKSTVSNVYMAGKGVGDRKVGVVYPLEGSGNAEMARTKSTFLFQTEDFNEYKDRFPRLLSTFQAGFRSIMNVPLFSKGQIIGGLLLRSLKSYAYTDEDVRLAERVGDQIAGAITNAYLFIERKQIEEERERLILQLQDALAKIKILRGMLPICSSCKKIRDDKGYWNQIESYIQNHSEAEFTHGICPECIKKLYPDFADKEK